jgi:hypothetical protein
MRTVKISRRIIVAAVVLVLLAGAGGAVAASRLGSEAKEEHEAFLNDVADRLDVERSALDKALREAAKARVDAAVAEGRLTKEQGERLKERLDSGELALPFRGGFKGFHGHRRGHFGHFKFLDAAAEYLDLSREELFDQLQDGKTLAQVAREQDKSVDGLKDAIVDSFQERLDEAVEDGRLTKAQRDQMLENMRSHVDDLVQQRLTRPGLGRPWFGPRSGDRPHFDRRPEPVIPS